MVFADTTSSTKPTLRASCVLAICCDYRIMAEGNFMIGLNEIPVGLIVPESIFHLYSFWIGKANAYRLLLEGRLLSPQEALKVGLVISLPITSDKHLLCQSKSCRGEKYFLGQSILPGFHSIRS